MQRKEKSGRVPWSYFAENPRPGLSGGGPSGEGLPEKVEADVPVPALSLFLPFEGFQLPYIKGGGRVSGLCSSSWGWVWERGMTRIIRSCYIGDKPESRLTACLDSNMRSFVCLFSREERPGRLSSLWVPQRALVSRTGLECSAERIVVLSLVRILQSGG